MIDKTPYTPGMREVLKLSKAEAGRLGHDYIGPEHYLLGVIRKGDGLAVQTLMNLDVDLEDVKMELERMVEIARRAGAAGAKLTGAGGGGSIVAACPGAVNEVVAALRSAGYSTIELNNDREAHWKT